MCHREQSLVSYRMCEGGACVFVCLHVCVPNWKVSEFPAQRALLSDQPSSARWRRTNRRKVLLVRSPPSPQRHLQTPTRRLKSPLCESREGSAKVLLLILLLLCCPKCKKNKNNEKKNGLKRFRIELRTDDLYGSAQIRLLVWQGGGAPAEPGFPCS